MSRRPHPLTGDQAASLVAAAGGGVAGVRNRALVTLLYRTGLRSNELVSADAGDLYEGTAGHFIRVEHPKNDARGAPHRELGLDSRTVEIVGEWLEIRSSRHTALFHTRSGRRLTNSYLRQLLPLLARRAGIGRRVHPHALRHTFARQLYEETGHDVVLVMQALGHKNLQTTQTYLQGIGATAVIAATSRRKW